MNILITGVAGFIGSHIAMHYLNCEDLVYGVDDFSTSSDNSAHFKQLLHHNNFTFKKGDISIDNLSSLFNVNHFDIIFNFASPASPLKYQSIALHTFNTSIMGMKNVLDFAKNTDTVVIQASSSEIYGEPIVIPQSETCWGNVNSYGPRSMYSESKRAAETLCWIYKYDYNVDVKICRLFNIYGPHMDVDDGRVVTNFIKQALNNQPLFIYGGNQTRSFCYISDLINAVTAIPFTHINNPINIGSNIEISIADLANKIIDITNSKSSISLDNYREDDPNRRCPDISLANSILNWYPKISIDDGLKLTIQYVRDLL